MGRLRTIATRSSQALGRAGRSAQEARRSGQEKYDAHRVQSLQRRVERDETEAALMIRQARAQKRLADAEVLTLGAQTRRKKAKAGLRESADGSILSGIGQMFGVGKPRKTSRASKRRKRTARRKP